MEPHIVLENFTVTIEGKEILRDISLEIPKKKVTVVIGPSGCGKSTLLRSINRMNDLVEGLACTGSLRIDGEDILRADQDVTELRRKAGMISQTPNPLPMSVYDNIIFGPRIHGLRDQHAMDVIVRDSLIRVGLWDEVSDRLHEPATRLSVGQQQRLCLARALANSPEILLCDETTSALDPISARIIENELMALSHEYTVLFVTHILRQAKRIADYVVFLYFGELVEAGPAEIIFSEPRDTRTRQYIEGTLG